MVGTVVALLVTVAAAALVLRESSPRMAAPDLGDTEGTPAEAEVAMTDLLDSPVSTEPDPDPAPLVVPEAWTTEPTPSDTPATPETPSPAATSNGGGPGAVWAKRVAEAYAATPIARVDVVWSPVRPPVPPPAPTPPRVPAPVAPRGPRVGPQAWPVPAVAVVTPTIAPVVSTPTPVLPAVSTRPALAAAAYVAPSVLTAVGQDDGPSGLRRLGALVTLLLLTLIAAAAIATGVWWAVHAVA